MNEQLLSLLRAALWQKPADTVFFKPATNWDLLYNLAVRQNVATLACAGWGALPPTLRPTDEWQDTVHSRVIRIQEAYRLLNRQAAETVKHLKAHHVSPVLLQGPAYARHYPQPAWRPCDDSCLYIDEKNDYLTRTVIWPAATETVSRSETAANSIPFYLHNVRVLLNHTLIHLDNPLVDGRFREWSRTQLTGKSHFMLIEGTAVSVPPPRFEVVFVFLHLYHLFLNGNVRLLHLCDWVMLLHAHRDAVYRTELKHLLQRFQLMHSWQLFGCVAVDHLGLPVREFPFYDSYYSIPAEKVLEIILHPEGLQPDIPPCKGSRLRCWQNKLHACLWHPRRLILLLFLVPHDILVRYGQFFYRIVRQLVFSKPKDMKTNVSAGMSFTDREPGKKESAAPCKPPE